MQFLALAYATAALLGAIFTAAAPTRTYPDVHIKKIILKFHKPTRNPPEPFELEVLHASLAVGARSTFCQSGPEFPYDIKCGDPDVTLQVNKGGLLNYFTDSWKITVLVNRYTTSSSLQAEQIRAEHVFSLTEASLQLDGRQGPVYFLRNVTVKVSSSKPWVVLSHVPVMPSTGRPSQ